ncbi:MAG: hypothetical protein KZQ86_08235 [Candidatus Thiodiazotropha sp. (ex Lucinoma kastoroae)]|nr:hypothetical protein [Candidatus Thiodiazotropha sp. (ex Lucinoma kastoroae)]
MAKQSKLTYIIGFFVILSIFCFAYVLVTSQNTALIQEKDSLNVLKNVKVEVCAYHGTRISKKCNTVDREAGTKIFQAFLSSSPTRGPSKAKIIFDEVIMFTGMTSPNNNMHICFIAVVYESLPNKTYFSSFNGNRSCNEIQARYGGYLVADISLINEVVGYTVERPAFIVR